MIEQEIAKLIREATKTMPSPEALTRLETAVKDIVCPTVNATLDLNTGRVTVRVGRPRHDERGLAFVIHPAEVRILVEDPEPT